MFLADGDIRDALASGQLVLAPLAEGAIQPASIDIRLAGGWQRQRPPLISDHRLRSYQYRWDYEEGGTLLHLMPGEFVLASTVEYIEVPADMLITVHGKSTLARRGLSAHMAGLLDPGFRGNITLELYNMGCDPINLRTGEFVAQLTVCRLAAPAQRVYSGRYQDQQGATVAR